jgi:ABC-type dipeptide/oligopeptide/nickel transport system permease component
VAHYIIRRLLQTVPVLVVTSLSVFLLLRLIPGDPASVIAGPDASPSEVAVVRQSLGLDKPLPQQYVLWLKHALTGDLGTSYMTHRSVGSLIKLAAPATAELALAAFILTLAIGVPLGIMAGVRTNSIWDVGLAGFAAVMQGIPNFVLGVIYLLVFTLALGWLPPGGRVDPLVQPLEGLRSLILPAITLGLPGAAIYARFVKTALAEVMTQDYVRTARAKGLAGFNVVVRHALRNALLPSVTIAGIQFGRVLGGTVIIEAIFAWPGMGRLALDAISDRDYILVQGIILLLVLAAVLVNLLTDLSYGILDPRIRAA